MLTGKKERDTLSKACQNNLAEEKDEIHYKKGTQQHKIKAPCSCFNLSAAE